MEPPLQLHSPRRPAGEGGSSHVAYVRLAAQQHLRAAAAAADADTSPSRQAQARAAAMAQLNASLSALPAALTPALARSLGHSASTASLSRRVSPPKLSSHAPHHSASASASATAAVGAVSVSSGIPAVPAARSAHPSHHAHALSLPLLPLDLSPWSTSAASEQQSLASMVAAATGTSSGASSPNKRHQQQHAQFPSALSAAPSTSVLVPSPPRPPAVAVSGGDLSPGRATATAAPLRVSPTRSPRDVSPQRAPASNGGPSPPKQPMPPSSQRSSQARLVVPAAASLSVSLPSTTPQLHHSHSVPAVTSGGSAQWPTRHSLGVSHSTASLPIAAPSAAPSNGGASTRPLRHSASTTSISSISQRLYPSPQSLQSLHGCSATGPLHPLPFVPRPLPPVVEPSHPVLMRWMALLALERDEGSDRTGVQRRNERISAMQKALDQSILAHEAACREEAEHEAARFEAREDAARQRTMKHAAMDAISSALVLAAAAAGEQVAGHSPRRIAAAPPRFGGTISSPLPCEDLGPSTLRFPASHAAFVCDCLAKVVGQGGRIAPVLGAVVKQLFAAVYSGFGAEQKRKEGLLHTASPEEKRASTDDGASLAPPSSDAVVPYSHVLHELNLEWHTCAQLMARYVDTQRAMHVQSLRAGDVLSSVRERWARTIERHAFLRWREVVRQRRRQMRAWVTARDRVELSPLRLQALFMHWRHESQLSLIARESAAQEVDVAAHTERLMVAMQARTDGAQEVARLAAAKKLHDSLLEDIASTRQALALSQVQVRAIREPLADMHRLMDGCFELLRASLDSMASELAEARNANLQDPLRLLVPSRRGASTDDSEEEEGSIAWARARKKELDAARGFFAGSDVRGESMLAHTHAKQKFFGARGGSSDSSSSSDSSGGSGFAQEVELLLLFVNFHLIQSQNKALLRAHDKAVAKAARRQQRLRGRRRRAAVDREASGGGTGAIVEDEIDQQEEDEEEQQTPATDRDDTMEWFDHSVPVKFSSLVQSDPRALQQRRAAAAKAVQSSGSEGDDENNSSAQQQHHSRAYYLSQFTSAEAMARRCDNFTSSLQDSELLLRLVGELAPPGTVRAEEALAHVDLQSRARALLRCLHSWDADLAQGLTPLDIVHAFRSDLLAVMLARLWIDHPHTGAQGSWIDRNDWLNNQQQRSSEPTVKPMLAGTNVDQLREALDSSAAARQNAARAEGLTDPQAGLPDFGPLHQLSLELVQLQHALAGRRQVPVECVSELHAVVQRTLGQGRRILDDAYARHELWHATRTRMKGFILQVLLAQARGKPVKLEDPRALREKERFCACTERGWEGIMKRGTCTGRQDADAAAAESEARRAVQTTAALAKAAAAGTLGHSVSEEQLSATAAKATALTVAIDRFRIDAAARDEAQTTTMKTRTNGTMAEERIDELEGVDFPYGRPQERFMDLLSVDNITCIRDQATGASPPPPSRTALAQSLSFELHLIESLLHLFYVPLRQIWKNYAQSDTSAASMASAGKSSAGTGAATGADGLNLAEYSSFVRDTGLGHPTMLPPRAMEQAFLELFMSPREKLHGDKSLIARRGELACMTALQFDPLTGQALPPKDKHSLEAGEGDFTELLVRIAFMRGVTSGEKKDIIDEWDAFQKQRKKEMREDRARRRMERRKERESETRARREVANASGMQIVDEEAEDNDGAWSASSASDHDEDDEHAAGAVSPLAHTVTGSQASIQSRLYEGMSSASASASSPPDGTAAAVGHMDETFGVNLRSPHLHCGLALRFFGLLKLHILPRASRVDRDPFRASYRTQGVARVFRKHAAPLRKLFFRYATLHSISVSVLDGKRAEDWTNTLDYSEFVSLLRDLGLVVEGNMGLGGREAAKNLLREKDVYAIFANVQQELHVAQAGAGVESRTVEKKEPGAVERAQRKKAAAANSGKKSANSTSRRNSVSVSKRAAGKAAAAGSTLSVPGSTAASQAPSRSVSDDEENDEAAAADDPEIDARFRARQFNADTPAVTEGEDAEADETGEDGVSELAAPSSVSAAAAAASLSSATASSELIYPEYLESLAAVALFRHPHPYRPVADRVEEFIVMDVLPHVNKLLKRAGDE